jgi:hypothetical protein
MAAFGRTLALSALALSLGGIASAAARPPSVDVVRERPLTIRGAAFRPAEHVRLTIRVGAKQTTRAVVATRRGTFTATVAAAGPYDPCLETLRVSAVGAAGSRASEKLPQRACAPQP